MPRFDDVAVMALRRNPEARCRDRTKPINFSERQQAQVIGSTERSLAFSEQPDTTALICWLFQDEMVKRLDAEIDAETDNGSALSHEERELRTAEIMNDILATERDEAALTWRAMEERLPVEFRPDIDPCAVLGLKMITVTNGHDEPSSPLHAFDVVRR